MLKNKGFLYGIGLGIIIGALLLQMMNAVTAQYDQLGKESVEEKTNFDNDEIGEAEQGGIEHRQADVDTGANVNHPETESPFNDPSLTDPHNDQVVPDVATQSERVELIIYRGESASTVANKLWELQLIDDKELWLARLSEEQLTGKLQYGQYSLEPGLSFEQLVTLITVR